MKQRNGAPPKASLHPKGAEGEIIACSQALLGFTCQWATGFVGSGTIDALDILWQGCRSQAARRPPWSMHPKRTARRAFIPHVQYTQRKANLIPVL